MIDMGDGNVALSPERADEMASLTVDWCLERYEEPVAAEVTEAIGRAVRERHSDADGASGKLVSYLGSLAHMGYLARRCEDLLDSIRSDTRALTEELAFRMSAGDDTAGALAEVAVTWCDFDDDPDSRVVFDSIDGLDGIRDAVCGKTVMASVSMAAQTGLAEEGELPEGVDVAEMFAIWRIGFLIRSCESSLPGGVTLTPDEGRTSHIVVDTRALEEAMGDWGEEHPDASQAEGEEAAREFAENPLFHLDTDNWPQGDSDDPKYAIFEVDHAGRIISQRG